MTPSPATPATPGAAAVSGGPLALLHVDDGLIVVDKPEGLLSVPGRGAGKADCAATRLAIQWPDARVVHRLDQATSGLLAFARGLQAQQRLAAAFERRAVDKRYVAVVAGLLPADEGEIALPLSADWPRRPRQRVDPLGGRPSHTRWRVLSRDLALQRTRLELHPLTGRSHQLRVHLQAIGHPIVGDRLYAPDAVALAEPRLLLHASALALPHPLGGDVVAFASPPPF